MKNIRIKFLSLSILCFFFVIVFRLFYWQIIKGGDLKEKALIQTYKLEKIIPSRGRIFSSDNFPLVLNQNLYLLSVYKPNLKSDLTSVLNQINSKKPGFLQDNASLVDRFTNNQNQKWIEFPTKFVSQETKDLNIPGLSFRQIIQRYYPENNLAKNIIGFIGKNDQGNDTGYQGLEGYYDKQLKGKTSFIWAAKDAVGNTILTKKIWQSEGSDGRDIYTNINRSLQYQTEKILMDGINKYSADSGSITIMNPETGAVLALANFEATSSATPSAYKNTAVSDLFEPGSIFKPLIVTMALDKNAIDTNYICDKCGAPHTIGEYTITNWDSEIHPNSTLQDIIKNSDNIGMSYVIGRLGLNNFLEYYRKLGLNQKSGIDLQGEAKAPLKDYWPEIDLATASFGQGIAVTQIKMLQLFNTLANGGYLITPRVTNYFSDSSLIIPTRDSKKPRIFTSRSTDQIKTILKYSVENGVVSKFKPDDLEVCAKSGTAQVAVKGKYTDSSTIASYIGFSPCNNPKFSMIVTINNPRTSPWGSSTAAPIWFELAAITNRLL